MGSPEKRQEKNTGKFEWIVFLAALLLLAVFYFYQEQNFPALSAYGIKNWETVAAARAVSIVSGRKIVWPRQTHTTKVLSPEIYNFWMRKGKFFILPTFLNRSLWIKMAYGGLDINLVCPCPGECLKRRKNTKPFSNTGFCVSKRL